MPNQEPGTVKPKTAKECDECVLVIGDETGEAAGILEKLDSAADERVRIERVSELSSGIDRMRGGGVVAVVLDLAFPDSGGMETFDKLFQAAPGVPILIVSGAAGEETAREAVRRGARDYVIKSPSDGYRLRRTVRTMLDSRAAEMRLSENEVANMTLDSIGEAVLRTDLQGKVTYLNQIAEKMTGWSRKEARGCPVADVLRIVDGGSREPVGTDLGPAKEENKAASSIASCTNCILVRRDGFEVGIESTTTLIREHDDSVTGAIVVVRDVSAARAKSLEMSHLAQHDALTDLPNRVLFNDRLAQAIALAKRQDKQLAVMFVDLDHFKKINDSLGHDVGDKLLQSVAERLKACVRRSDTIGRLGGDEFVVLLSQVEHAEDAAISARKALRALTAPHAIDGKSLDLNVSIGVSTYPSDGQDAESLLNRADNAMYEAKQRGRNNYQFFRHEMHAKLADRQSLEADLRCALGRNEFVLHYQPKLNLQTGQITGVEALIRWLHPQRGLIYPEKFVPLAEECGLILGIGQWVLLEACSQARAWRDGGLGIVPVSVNVSATEFGAKDFLSGVRAVLIASGVEPQNLELELTESVLMRDADAAVVTLVKLKAMGVQVAIDDFGTGYSSFTYLRRFPSDALKLHHSFVQEIAVDPRDAAIVSAMINIGRSLKQRIIAEGVETSTQLQFLRHHGCGEGQGYFFSRPVVAERVANLFKVGILDGVVH
jgi:diguanylate cyclase (GGDEF)-like protein/PAS domain S-box-containing protein